LPPSEMGLPAEDMLQRVQMRCWTVKSDRAGRSPGSPSVHTKLL